MKHDATNNPHHCITLKVGDRLKGQKMTNDLRPGDLYEVTGFKDLDFPENDRSTTSLLNVTHNRRVSVNNNEMQAGFRDGAWTLA